MKKAKAKIEKKQVEKQFITREEILTMDLSKEVEKNKNLDLKNMQTQMELLDVKQQSLVYQNININLEKQINKYKMDQLRAESVKSLDNHKKIVNDVKEKYGVEKENWGYHPETGEIIFAD